MLRLLALIAAVLYPVGKGHPQRSPGITLLSLLGTGEIWYWGFLALLIAIVVGSTAGLMLWDYLTLGHI